MKAKITVYFTNVAAEPAVFERATRSMEGSWLVIWQDEYPRKQAIFPAHMVREVRLEETGR